MIINVLSMMPDDWKTTITVIPRQGRDASGDPLPDGYPFEVPGCMIGPAGVAGDNRRWEGPFRTDTTDTTLHVYAPPRTPIYSRDVILVPDGYWMSGVMAVDGDPMSWPYGVDASLRRINGTGEVPEEWRHLVA